MFEVACIYHTVSEAVILVIAGITHIGLLASDRKRINEKKKKGKEILRLERVNYGQLIGQIRRKRGWELNHQRDKLLLGQVPERIQLVLNVTEKK